MTTQSVSVSGVAASAALPLDPNSVGASIGVFLDVGAGSTVTVQVTPDDPAGASPVWYATGVAALTGATADAVAALPFPARAIRLNQTVAGAASVMRVVTAGII